jgi:hypothetical protein
MFLVNSYQFGGGVVPSIDPDAEAFLTAAAITDPTITSAIDTLVVQLKVDGLWTKMKALYPFVGGTATTHKYNLKDPRDLDVAYRLDFVGGWTHNADGAKPNGTNADASTFFNFSAEGLNNDSSFMVYLTDNIVTAAGAPIIIGAFQSGTSSGTFLRTFGTLGNTTNCAHYNVATVVNTQSETDGFWLASRSGSAGKLFRNDNFIMNNLGGISANFNVFLGALNNTGSATNRAEQPIGLAALGSALDDTEASTMYTIIQDFQTALSREV